MMKLLWLKIVQYLEHELDHHWLVGFLFIVCL